ncbi:MAG: UDP-glucose 4-epimerase GalE [Bacteroidales bacterium]|nr:UDP-glucose 4-epimerase GalE [Bacteroidales bacterium]
MRDKILVTGGTGFIGSHTVVELQNEGFDVVIVDNFSNSEPEVADRISQITGIKPVVEPFDLCVPHKVNDLFARHSNIKAVIHFAALKAVGESVLRPLEYYHNNLSSLLNLMSAMKQHGTAAIVFSSSCTVYGQPSKLPVTETDPIAPAMSPYGNTKQISEEILKDSAAAYPDSFRAISLRYFNPIGAHPSALIGELPRGVPENLVPYLTQTAMGLRKELSIFGNDYDTPDGTAIRDYLHVVDLAKAHVVSVKRLLETANRKSFEVFNLGTGKGVSVLEAINSFEKVSGVRIPYRIAPRRQGDIEKIWADPSLANRVLGWKTVSSLDDAMLTAWNWEQQLRKKEGK